MIVETKSPDELRQMAYRKRLVVNRLQNDLAAETELETMDAITDELVQAQADLLTVEEALAAAERAAGAAGEERRPQATARDPGANYRDGFPSNARREASGTTRSMATTGLDVTIDNFMEHLPTAFYHLLDEEKDPLVVYTIRTSSSTPRRLRVIAYIEGYTARAVDTLEVKRNQAATVSQLPTLFPHAVRDLNELTRATLNILAEDLDTGKVEEHRTETIWLLARTTAPRYVRDAVTGESIDFSRYLAAFVTPNEPSVMKFQRRVAEKHHEKRLRGYGGDVESQVEAIYNALKEDLAIAYVHSYVSFDLDDGVRSQRVRLPRECIDGQMGNCIDASLLFASLLEGISLNPAIVFVPGHVFVGWQMAEDRDEWAYLETTMLQTNTFREAKDVGTKRAASYKKRLDATGNPAWFKSLVISELRIKDGITPVE